MLIGGKKDREPTPAPAGNVFDITTVEFEDAVIKASMDMPILVDFWAPWCGPCKQLGPVLETAVEAAGGKIRMAKVNIDENPDLAQALRVQSVPTVYAFFQGQPVTAFAGARPASEIKTLIDQLVKLAAQGRPDAINIGETLPLAARALADGDIATAQNLYAQILDQDENNVHAYSGLIRSFIASGDLEQAGFMIDDAPPTIAADPLFSAARTALDLARGAPGTDDLRKLAAAVEQNPEGNQARYDYAMALFGAGEKSVAVDQLLDIMRRDRGNENKWEGDKARIQILKFFEAMGPSDPETIAGRRKLSSLLFS